MKKLIAFIVLGASVSFFNCGEKKSDKKQEKITLQPKKDTPKQANTDNTALIAKGKKLFKDKTCFTCHMPKEKGIGPSITEINKIYSDKNADIIAFLKGELKAIVDTDPGQVAVMKANLDGFVKDLKDPELNALKAYMLSVN